MDLNLYYILVGALVGLLIGLTGVGGGSLMTPLLVLLFGFQPSTAVGTDLLFASMTKTVGSTVHGWRGTVDWVIVRRLASGSVTASIITLAVLHYFGAPSGKMEGIIAAALGVALVLTGISTLFRTQIIIWATRRFGTRSKTNLVGWTVALGATLGVLVSITSIGAGAMGVIALLVLYPGMSVSRIVGTDIAHAVPLTLVAGIGHWFIGTVDFSLLGSLLVGSIPAVILGSMIGSRASDRALKPVLAIVLLIVGAKLLL